MYSMNLHPLLDCFILLVAARGFLEPDGKLFFAWTLNLLEKITDPALWLPATLRIPGWKRFAALQAAGLLILMRALAMFAADLLTNTFAPLPIWVGSCQFQLNPLPGHLHLFVFSLVSVVATGLLIVGLLVFIHYSVSLDYRQTPLGLLLAELFPGWNRCHPLLRLAQWLIGYAVFVYILFLLSGAWVTPPGAIPTPLLALVKTAVVSLWTLWEFLVFLQWILWTALFLVVFRIPRNAFFDLIESLAEAICSPLRDLDLFWKNVDWTYPIALITLTFLKTGLRPLLELLAEVAQLPLS
jgi:hypothetical protein